MLTLSIFAISRVIGGLSQAADALSKAGGGVPKAIFPLSKLSPALPAHIFKLSKGAVDRSKATTNAFIWETLPATATEAQHATSFDFDSDGANNLNEFASGAIVTNPAP